MPQVSKARGVHQKMLGCPHHVHLLSAAAAPARGSLGREGSGRQQLGRLSEQADVLLPSQGTWQGPAGPCSEVPASRKQGRRREPPHPAAPSPAVLSRCASPPTPAYLTSGGSQEESEEHRPPVPATGLRDQGDAHVTVGRRRLEPRGPERDRGHAGGAPGAPGTGAAAHSWPENLRWSECRERAPWAPESSRAHPPPPQRPRGAVGGTASPRARGRGFPVTHRAPGPLGRGDSPSVRISSARFLLSPMPLRRGSVLPHSLRRPLPLTQQAAHAP